MSLEETKVEWDSNYFEEELTKRYLPQYGRKFYENITDVSGDILDVGCSDFGCFSEDIKTQNNVRLIGLDISKIALARATRRNFKFKSVNPILGAAQDLPFKENSFDKVLCIETMMQTGRDYKKVLEELRRVSKGDIVLTFYHKDFAEKQGLLVKDNIAEYKRLDKTKKTIATFNEDDVTGLMEEKGLEIKKMKTYTLEKLNTHEKNVPQETKGVIYIECKKKS
jgi:ubiquinone/menaquinone biosynthesis C-methylase UbiE